VTKHARMRARDIRYLWHPYTEITSFEKSAFPIIQRAKGCSLYDMDGREFLDGTSSWWCVNLGHSHPRLLRALRRQAERLQHVLLGGASHTAAIGLAQRLARIAPGGLGHAMFASDGSCAVEAAIKIALQYWLNLGQRGRTHLIALADGYHGDSLGAVGAGFIRQFHGPFAGAIRQAFTAASPHCNQCPHHCVPQTCDVPCFESMRKLVRRHSGKCAAVIVEPLCQAAAGMRIYPTEYLRRLRKLCDEHRLLLICDEIAVGFGRTGAMFACDHADIVPDIMTLGKGLTGGMLPMSATLVSDAIYDTFRRDGDRLRTFFHGHTFCGNPLASAVANAAIDAYQDQKVIQNLKVPMARLHEGMQRVAEALDNAPLRTLGMIAAIEIPAPSGGADRASQMAQRARSLGLLVRPLGNSIYLWPPLTASPRTLNRMTAIYLEAALQTRPRTKPPGSTRTIPPVTK